MLYTPLMAQRKVLFAPEEYYHIYNRGNSKQTIFHDDADRTRFIQLLFLSNASNPFNTADLRKGKGLFEHDRGEALISIGAYIVMPNHFHVLLRHVEDGDISKFMQKLTTVYSMYYNAKYKRTGGLFEGKFKATHVATDRYLRYLFSYIHLNCIKLIDKTWRENGLKDKNKALGYLHKYKWSSYLDYAEVKQRTYSSVLDKKAFPNYFSSPEAIKKDIFQWINYNS